MKKNMNNKNTHIKIVGLFIALMINAFMLGNSRFYEEKGRKISYIKFVYAKVESRKEKKDIHKILYTADFKNNIDNDQDFKKFQEQMFSDKYKNQYVKIKIEFLENMKNEKDRLKKENEEYKKQIKKLKK